MPKHVKKIKKRIQPVEGRKNGRKIRVAKDKFVDDEVARESVAPPPVTTEGSEMAELEREAKRITSRKFKVKSPPKPASLAEQEAGSTLSEETETEIAPLEPKRKIKRKKKKK